MQPVHHPKGLKLGLGTVQGVPRSGQSTYPYCHGRCRSAFSSQYTQSCSRGALPTRHALRGGGANFSGGSYRGYGGSGRLGLGGTHFLRLLGGGRQLHALGGPFGPGGKGGFLAGLGWYRNLSSIRKAKKLSGCCSIRSRRKNFARRRRPSGPNHRPTKSARLKAIRAN